MEHQKILERLSVVVESVIGREPYDKEIAKELDMSPANYSNMKKKGSLPLEQIINYCALKKVSINWLLYEQSSKMLVDNTGDILKIKYLQDATISAGGGSFNDDESFTYLSLDPSYAKMLGITEKDNIDAINVTGESMNPTIKEGSIILIDRGKTTYQEGKIFALNVSGNLFIKRLVMNTRNGYDLISDNNLIAPQSVNIDEVVIVGKIIGALEKI
jgi:phage repressor protein C with HTH and peptisase S24 domain